MSSVYVVGTFDTKGGELQYVAALIAAEGVPVTTVDVGTGPPGAPGAPGGPGDAGRTEDPGGSGEPGVGVPAREVAAHHPDGAGAVFTGDRGSAAAAMAVALEHFTRAHAADIAAIIGLGGSGGTALITPAMRALPIGRPKVMVSTVASGDVAPYVGPSDIAMLYSVRGSLAGRPARGRQRQRHRRRHGPGGAAGRPAHPGAGRRQRHRPVHDQRSLPA